MTTDSVTSLHHMYMHSEQDFEGDLTKKNQRRFEIKTTQSPGGTGEPRKTAE